MLKIKCKDSGARTPVTKEYYDEIIIRSYAENKEYNIDKEWDEYIESHPDESTYSKEFKEKLTKSMIKEKRNER